MLILGIEVCRKVGIILHVAFAIVDNLGVQLLLHLCELSLDNLRLLLIIETLELVLAESIYKALQLIHNLLRILVYCL